MNLATGTGLGGDAGGDVLSGVENVIGSKFSDVLTGSAEANSLNGDEGDDFLQGAGGSDTLIGGSGVDTASYQTLSAAVTINLGQVSASGDMQKETNFIV